MECTADLKREHDLLGRVLAALARAAEEIASGGRVDERFLVGFSDFAQGFVYRCHQLKEDHLFHILEDAGLSRERAPLAALLTDHEECLDHVIAMFKALPRAGRGDAHAARCLVESAAAYRELLRTHMEAEEFVFEFSESVLSDADDRSAVSLFQTVERDLGEEAVRRYRAFAEEVARDPAGAPGAGPRVEAPGVAREP